MEVWSIVINTTVNWSIMLHRFDSFNGRVLTNNQSYLKFDVLIRFNFEISVDKDLYFIIIALSSSCRNFTAQP